MNWPAVFKRKKNEEKPTETPMDLDQLTSVHKEMDIPKTLDQSLENLAVQAVKIQGLEDQIKSATAEIKTLNGDLQACMTLFGLSQTETEHGVQWESSKVSDLSNTVKELTAVRDELGAKLNKAELRIGELLADQKTVASRALEFLAAQGGKPLPLSGTGKPAPSGKAQVMEAMDEARRAGDLEAQKRYFEEYQKLKRS